MEKSSEVVRTGKWCKEEDDLLKACVLNYGEGNWHLIPERSGLKRCRKSCRMRWLNYLKPDIKKGDFSDDEIDMMIRLHKLLGNRWSVIARLLAGRTANGVKNFWNTHVREKKRDHQLEEKAEETSMIGSHTSTLIKPRPLRLSRSSPSSSWSKNNNNYRSSRNNNDNNKQAGCEVGEEDNSTNSGGPDEEKKIQEVDEKSMEWWKCLPIDESDTDQISTSSLLSTSSSSSMSTFDQFWDERLTWIDDDFPLHTTLTDFNFSLNYPLLN